MVGLEVCGVMNDTLCTGCMKYPILDPRYEPMGVIIRNINKHRWTDITGSVSRCKQTLDTHKVLIGHYLCE